MYTLFSVSRQLRVPVLIKRVFSQVCRAPPRRSLPKPHHKRKLFHATLPPRIPAMRKLVRVDRQREW